MSNGSSPRDSRDPGRAARPGAGSTALVTGAGSGIGRATAVALAGHGFRVILVGRREESLSETAAMVARNGGRATTRPCDIGDAPAVDELGAAVTREVAGELAVLVHSAGEYTTATLDSTAVAEFDRVLRANTRGPFQLTKELLPAVRRARGDIVFVNSSAALRAPAGVGVYAASKAALRALADSLRQEVNADGVRVLSVYPGRVATPMQERIALAEGRAFAPDRLIQPSEVAEVIVAAVLLGGNAELTDLHVRPLQKP